MLNIKHITEEGTELEIIRQLFREYESELDENICFQSFEEELNDPLIKYGQPSGLLILAYWKNEPDSYRVAGCIAMTAMKEKGVCELKRLYVRPQFRKNKIGKELVEKIIEVAKKKNYSSMRLDTLSKLQPAISIYEKFGFKNISAYYDNPLDGVVYMEKHF